MLHELLLALTGHLSPLLDEKKVHALTKSLSPSERSLLRSLACLGSLQARIREQCTKISASHTSNICRAVCASVTQSHLSRFNEKIVDVESSILRSDAEYVGAYDIVPLSAIVAAFDGWERVFTWLGKLVARMGLKETEPASKIQMFVSGSQLLDFLRCETHTGYPKIEHIASDLLRVAETTWIRQLIPWLLYGRLPPYGRGDFFIQHTDSSYADDPRDRFTIIEKLAPDVLDRETALSILYVGRSVRHIQRGQAKLSPASAADLESARSTVLSEQFTMLEAVELPLTTFSLRQTVHAMRSTLSRNALQKLLPFSDIVHVLDILKQFFLLKRGEFAVALIGAADDCLAGRHLKGASHKDRARLGGMMIKEGEVNSVLARTWASLAALQDINEDDEDEDLEFARGIIGLSIRRQQDHRKDTPVITPASRLETQAVFFDDVLLATPTILTIKLSSPLDIFLSEQDVHEYSLIHAYLLGIRRAHLHLADLWKLSTLRRSYLAPHARGEGNTANRGAARNGAETRSKRMRGVWAALSHARFFFAQINDYLQGEVVEGCTESLERWIISEGGLGTSNPSRPTTRQGPRGSNIRDGEDIGNGLNATASGQGNTFNPGKAIQTSQQAMTKAAQTHQDPEALSAAHRAYLAQLKDSLLLDEAQFVTSLRNLMTRTDHATALTQRLEVVTQINQLGEHVATEPNSLHGKEESDLLKSLDSVRKSINSNLEELLRGLRALDERRRVGILPSQRLAEGSGPNSTNGHAGTSRGGFSPWHGPGLSRLLLRLESSGYED